MDQTATQVNYRTEEQRTNSEAVIFATRVWAEQPEDIEQFAAIGRRRTDHRKTGVKRPGWAFQRISVFAPFMWQEARGLKFLLEKQTEALIRGEVDAEAVREARARFGFLADRRPELYRALGH